MGLGKIREKETTLKLKNLKKDLYFFKAVFVSWKTKGKCILVISQFPCSPHTLGKLVRWIVPKLIHLQQKVTYYNEYNESQYRYLTKIHFEYLLEKQHVLDISSSFIYGISGLIGLHQKQNSAFIQGASVFEMDLPKGNVLPKE